MKTTVGIERERFIVNRATRKIVPSIGLLLPEVRRVARRRGVSPDSFIYEFFAGQIEDRTPPCSSMASLGESLRLNDEVIDEAANQIGLAFEFCELAPEDRIESLEINPFDVRHSKIWDSLTPERRLSGSIVAATHVHLAVTEEHAVRILNACREDVVERLVILGDHSCGQRMVSYRKMAQITGIPPEFSSYGQLKKYIDSCGGEKNVWDLVRYKPYTKTIEFRMFGTTSSIQEIFGYVQACYDIFNST